MSKNFNPTKDNILVKRTKEETTTAGGIVLPGSAAEKPSQGEVVAVGPGRTDDKGEVRPVSLKVGDIIVFNQYAGGTTVKLGDQELMIMSENDVLGTLS